MRLLHTADLHLRADRPETVAALDAVLDAARDRGADLLTVGGDMFDRPRDVDELRPALRERFADAGLPVLVIPGNHDEAAFRRNLDFGRAVEPLVDRPFERREVGGATVVGVPYAPEFTDDLYEGLRAAAPDDRPGVLLLHATLDVGFGRGDVGAEDATRYCPVSKETLAELGYDYVLAGHIHSAFDHRRLDGGGHFVYPGSPCSHASSETGRRRAALVDLAAGSVEAVPLPTHYHDRGEWTVHPGEAEAVLDEIDAWVAERAAENCEYEVAVDGFLEMDEATFGDRLATIAGEARVENRTRNVGRVLDHELYQRFRRHLEEREDLAEPGAVEDLLVETLGELLAEGRVRA